MQVRRLRSDWQNSSAHSVLNKYWFLKILLKTWYKTVTEKGGVFLFLQTGRPAAHVNI